ncbi:hypothetical protein EXIGLDRAFT_718584 [Exidia glandulosa HHB12029]|uniref:Uncharacterized protein n=1 Tax=Exidia glandulosa HHB12029 TaxID=1314781 RepID=A0A165HQ64_EXIGL|nr:hypothetical protein EXIGLDRAFT_718584 [Exidia glandulosa HHB12029]
MQVRTSIWFLATVLVLSSLTIAKPLTSRDGSDSRGASVHKKRVWFAPSNAEFASDKAD